MKKRFSTLFYPRKDKANEAAVAPMYLRITIDGIRGEYSMKLKLPLDTWDEKRECAKGNSGDALRLNAEIERLKSRIYEVRSNYANKDQLLTTEKLMELINNTSSHSAKSLNDAIKAQYEKVYNGTSIGYSKSTADRYRTIQLHVGEFLPLEFKRDDILLQELNYSFAEKYTNFLRTVRKCNHNSTMKYMKMLKAVIHYAQKNQWVIKDPFNDFECPIEKVDTVYLNNEELSKIENLELSIDRLRTIRDIFIFACYTGISYIDITALSLDNIIKHDLHYLIKGRRKKTNEPYTSFLLPKCKHIIDKYKDNPICQNKGVIFPTPSNQKTNAYLKEIADLCGITKNLTFHVARRTFATTVALGNNIPTEVIQAVLGHSSIKTTQIYAKTTDELIINSFKNFK